MDKIKEHGHKNRQIYAFVTIQNKSLFINE